jgi:hypothetical protein
MKTWRREAQGRTAKRKCKQWAGSSMRKKEHVKELKRYYRGWLGALDHIQLFYKI